MWLTILLPVVCKKESVGLSRYYSCDHTYSVCKQVLSCVMEDADVSALTEDVAVSTLTEDAYVSMLMKDAWICRC